MKKFKLLISITLLSAFAFGSNTLANTEIKPVVPYENIQFSKVVKVILDMARQGNDSIYYMAAAKMIDSIRPISIYKESAKDKDLKDMVDSDFWTAAELFDKVVSIVGEKSELGKQAARLSLEIRENTNAEGMWGYCHYHIVYRYDGWMKKPATNDGELQETVHEIIWHGCDPEEERKK